MKNTTNNTNMKNLFLIRHGKSSWKNYSSDFERVLKGSGVIKSKIVANATKHLVPENAVVWSSSANRAKSTCLLFAEIYNINKNLIQFNPDLYTFDFQSLVQQIKKCPDSVNNLIIFGHNPAFTDFVNKFGNQFIDNLPTSGFVKLTFDSNDWQLQSKGKTKLFITPRTLNNE